MSVLFVLYNIVTHIIFTTSLLQSSDSPYRFITIPRFRAQICGNSTRVNKDCYALLWCWRTAAFMHVIWRPPDIVSYILHTMKLHLIRFNISVSASYGFFSRTLIPHWCKQRIDNCGVSAKTVKHCFAHLDCLCELDIKKNIFF